MKNKLVALVLQGGGMVGAFECGAIRAIYEDGRFVPDVVSGVSAGAVNAGILAGHYGDDPVKSLYEFWEWEINMNGRYLPRCIRKTLTVLISLLGNTNPWMLFPFFATHIYEKNPFFKGTLPFRHGDLKKFIDVNKLNTSDISVVVTSTNVQTGDLEGFRNWDENEISLEQIQASGSPPILAPIMEIGSSKQPGYYWDGGIFSNTPMAPALKRLDEITPEDREIDRYIISIDLWPKLNPQIPTNMPEAMNRFSEIFGSNKTHSEVRTFEKEQAFIDFLYEMERVLKTVADEKVSDLLEDPRIVELFQHELYKHKRVRTIRICNPLPMPLFDGLDFSKPNVEALINAGYTEAKKVLDNFSEE